MVKMPTRLTRDQWVLTFRRSFSVPDVVTDESALEAIAWRMARAAEMPTYRWRKEVIVSTINVVVDCAVAGELDPLFLDQETNDALRSEVNPWDVETRITSALLTRNVDRTIPKMRTRMLISHLLSTIAAYVEAHPFQLPDLNHHSVGEVK